MLEADLICHTDLPLPTFRRRDVRTVMGQTVIICELFEGADSDKHITFSPWALCSCQGRKGIQNPPAPGSDSLHSLSGRGWCWGPIKPFLESSIYYLPGPFG